MKCKDNAELDFWILDPEGLLNLPDDHWLSDAVAKGLFYSEIPKHEQDKWKFFVDDPAEKSYGITGDVVVKHPGGFLQIYNIMDFYDRFTLVSGVS